MTALGERVFIALGSNVGDRRGCLAFARSRLAMLEGCGVVAASTIEETAPLGPVPQGPYLNQMVLVRTTLSPHDVLAHCQEIEAAAGRDRTMRWGPRTLDLDIVRFGDRVIETPDLRVPHPELPHRPFWQRQLAELERRGADARDADA